MGEACPEFDSIVITDASISTIDVEDGYCRNVIIQSSTIEEVNSPSSPPIGFEVKECLIGKVTGASSIAGLGDWISNNEIDHFESVKTTSCIREANLDVAHEFLATVIKKTFFQPGSGRKEEALTRGLTGHALSKVAPRVLGILTKNGILGTFKGTDGVVYKPNRSHAGRMQKMLDELRSSQDEVWLQVGAL